LCFAGMARLFPIPRVPACAVLLALLSLSSRAAAAADLTMVSKLSGLKGGQTITEYVSRDKVRVKEGHFETLFDTGAGRITSIDHAGKTYYETSLDEVQAYMAAVRGAAPTPSAAASAAPVSVRKGDAPKTIAGRACEHYLLAQGGVSLEVWLDPSV